MSSDKDPVTESPTKPATEPKARRHPDPETRLAEIDAEILRVRARDEKRLIAIADKAGLFKVRLSVAQMHKMIDDTLAEIKPPPSMLITLKERKARIARDLRKADARRKTIMGGFLVAQCRHKPDLHARIVSPLRTWLEDHPTAYVAERNLALVAGFLDDPAADDDDAAPGRADPGPRTRRLILLGTWLLAQRQTDPALATLITDELEGFLRDDGSYARHKDLLADVL